MTIRDDWYKIFSWAMVVLSFSLSLLFNPLVGGSQPTLIFIFALPLVLVHGVRRYGWKGMSVFVVVTYVISTFWESLSINTGFPFGNYHYTMFPQIFDVAFLIGPAYISLGYTCWHVANAMFQEADAKLSKYSSAILVSIISAVAMTVYDLATDVAASTVGHAWIWEQGGSFFGVPVSNFLGWWFCTFTFYIVFSLFLRSSPRTVNQRDGKVSILQFILIYANLGVTVVVNYFFDLLGNGEVVDQSGRSWALADISGSSLLWAVFGMFVLALLAIVYLYRDDSKGTR